MLTVQSAESMGEMKFSQYFASFTQKQIGITFYTMFAKEISGNTVLYVHVCEIPVVIKALKCKTLGGILRCRLWMQTNAYCQGAKCIVG